MSGVENLGYFGFFFYKWARNLNLYLIKNDTKGIPFRFQIQCEKYPNKAKVKNQTRRRCSAQYKKITRGRKKIKRKVEITKQTKTRIVTIKSMKRFNSSTLSIGFWFISRPIRSKNAFLAQVYAVFSLINEKRFKIW